MLRDQATHENTTQAEEIGQRAAFRAANNARLRANAIELLNLAKSTWAKGQESDAVRLLQRMKLMLMQIRYTEDDRPDQALLSLRDTVIADLKCYDSAVNAKQKRCELNAALSIQSILKLAYDFYRQNHNAQSLTLYKLHEQRIVENLGEQFKFHWNKFDACEIPLEFEEKLAERICGTTTSGIKPIGWKKTFASMCVFNMPNVSIANIDACLRDIGDIFTEYKPKHTVKRMSLQILMS